MSSGKPSIYWLSKAAEMLGKISPLVGSALALLLWFYGIVAAAVVGGITAVNALLDSIDLSFMKKMTPETITWIGYANAVFPLVEMLEALGIYYTAWGIVILARWIKSLIPTVSN